MLTQKVRDKKVMKGYLWSWLEGRVVLKNA